MSKKPETLFRERIRPKLDGIPGTWWESIQQKAILGSPDIIGCVAGYFVGLELKADEFSKVSKLQELKLRQIAAAGGLGIVVHPGNWSAVYDMLCHLAEKK